MKELRPKGQMIATLVATQDPRLPYQVIEEKFFDSCGKILKDILAKHGLESKL